MANTERDVLFQLLDALEQLQVPYMIVGSFASTYWGRPRLTHDADLVVEIPQGKAPELAALLAPEFYAPDFVIEEAVRKQDQFNAVHLRHPFKVDLWVRKETAYDLESFRRRHEGTMFGRKVWIISAEDSILSKLRWYQAGGSDRQVQDALEVYEIQEPQLDQAYLDAWSAHLGVATLLDQIRQQAARPPDWESA